MKHTLGMATAILALAVTQSAYATPTNISDNYIGSDNNGWGDVIGSTANFDVLSMDVELIGNMLSVSVNTNFAGKGDQKLFSSLTNNDLSNGNGIGYGDLFLATEWNPYGDAPYIGDNASNGTQWDLAFSLDDRWTDGGTGNLYSLDGSENELLLSENFLSGGTFRNGQEMAVNRDGKRALSSDIEWDITSGSINFLIDLTGTALEDSNTIALRWGMTCGNDTIEGEYTVPEPAMLGLLALGLIGIGFSQRRKTKA